MMYSSRSVPLSETLRPHQDRLLLKHLRMLLIISARNIGSVTFSSDFSREKRTRVAA